MRRDFRGDFSAQKNLRLEVGHEFIRAQGVVVADEFRAETGDGENTGGDKRDEKWTSFRGLRIGDGSLGKVEALGKNKKAALKLKAATSARPVTSSRAKST